MSDSSTPAGWFPDGQRPGQDRYWDGTAWTDQYRPSQMAQPYYPQQVPQKKSHTLRNVLLVLVLLGVLAIGGCFAIVGATGKAIDDAIDDEAKNDKPTAVVEGKAFEHDGFSVADGWRVASQSFGGATIKDATVTLMDDQDVTSGGRSALLTFRLYDGKTVVSEISCTSNEMQEGETSKLDCSSLDTEKLGAYDAIKVADLF